MGYRFGKLPPKTDYRTLRLGTYLASTLPPPPPSFSILTGAVFPKLKATAADITTLFPMDGNDRYGDCTIAGLSHAITVFRAMTSVKRVMTTAQVEKIYFHLSGGQDTGLNMLDVLNYWTKSTITTPSERIRAFVKINPHNHTHVQQAIALFGGVYLGFQCQAAVQSDFEAHRVWTPGPLDPDGHCVFATGYDQTTVEVLTWGATQRGTWGWWDECVDEAYAIIPIEASSAQFEPGLNLTQLLSDLNQVAN